MTAQTDIRSRIEGLTKDSLDGTGDIPYCEHAPLYACHCIPFQGSDTSQPSAFVFTPPPARSSRVILRGTQSLPRTVVRAGRPAL